MVGNANVNGLHSLIVKNTDTGSNSAPIFYLTTSVVSVYMFLNSSGRTVDGGPNSLTLRNSTGATKIQSQGGKGLTISPSTGNVTIDSTTPALSSTTGALVVNGGITVRAHVVSGGNLYANTAVYANGQKCATEP
ncbi:hypothetical protein SpCBS45565_g03784 [Spizellomyces sp. 'palustris']|nr:hypothetical protein SpCBS45565_g03784 [Spizellomyces sp. 'palustris']